MYNEGHLRLSTMMGSYPKTARLKSGDIKPSGADLEFDSIETAQKGFKAAVNDLKFDVAEMAIVTFLQAFSAGKPLVLLPFVMNGNFHHKSLICRADDDLTPEQLPGRRVAMRSYTQTTPTWVRGILSDEYGVKIDTVTWLSKEPGHVAGYQEPPWVQQINDPRSLDELLKAGEVDAILASGMADKPGLRTLIPNPDGAAKEWYAANHVVPINHMVAVRKELAEERPDIIKAIYGSLVESRASVDGGVGVNEDGVVLQPAGFEAVSPALEMAVRYAHEQGLISERYSVESLYGAVLRAFELQSIKM